MTPNDALHPRARIPYGSWGSSYFPAWQQSPLAEVNIGQFAGEAAARIYALRKVPKSQLEYLVIGSTVPWHWNRDCGSGPLTEGGTQAVDPAAAGAQVAAGPPPPKAGPAPPKAGPAGSPNRPAGYTSVSRYQ